MKHNHRDEEWRTFTCIRCFIDTVHVMLETGFARFIRRTAQPSLGSDDYFGYWTMHRYQEDHAMGAVVLGQMTQTEAIRKVNEMPATKIMHIDAEKGFIFVQ